VVALLAAVSVAMQACTQVRHVGRALNPPITTTTALEPPPPPLPR
jgi:hypothetical protein